MSQFISLFFHPSFPDSRELVYFPVCSGFISKFRLEMEAVFGMVILIGGQEEIRYFSILSSMRINKRIKRESLDRGVAQSHSRMLDGYTHTLSAKTHSHTYTDTLTHPHSQTDTHTPCGCIGREVGYHVPKYIRGVCYYICDV